MGTGLAFDSQFIESYRFFRSYGADAQHAMRLATNERALMQLCETDEYRIHWEDDDNWNVHDWAPREKQEKYRKELQDGTLVCQGVMLQKREGVTWVTVDSCWGIYLYKDQGYAESRYHQAEILNPFAPG